MASGPITSWQIVGKTVETVSDFIFLGSKITADGDCSHEIKRRLLLGRKVMTNIDSILKSRDITLSAKVCLVKAMVFSSGHVLGYKESWVPKNWCCWTVLLEKTLESHLDCKEIQPVHPKVDQSWVFIGRTDVEAETPVLWPPEDEMVGWHHWLSGHELGKLQELVMGRETWHDLVLGVTKSWTLQRLNWIEPNISSPEKFQFNFLICNYVYIA